MTRIEELVVIRAPAAAARRAVLSVAAMREWSAPDVAIVPPSRAELAVGDRFRIEVVGGFAFDYVVEAASDREVVFTYDGSWRGIERWSFVPDGADTVVRRAYTVEGGSLSASLLWATVGRAAAGLHLRYELSRLRDLVEREPGPRAEIPASAASHVVPPAHPSPEPPGGEGQPGAGTTPFPVDDG